MVEDEFSHNHPHVFLNTRGDTAYLAKGREETFEDLDQLFGMAEEWFRESGHPFKILNYIDDILKISGVEAEIAKVGSGETGIAPGRVSCNDLTAKEMSQSYRGLKMGIEILQDYREVRHGSRADLDSLLRETLDSLRISEGDDITYLRDIIKLNYE